MVISRSTLDGISSDRSGPLTITTHTASGDWILNNQTIDDHGQAAALPSWFSDCVPPPPDVSQPGVKTAVTSGKGTLEACLTRLTGEGYRQLVVYQAHNQFWRLQWAETGLYLAVSALLAGFRSGGPGAVCHSQVQVEGVRA